MSLRSLLSVLVVLTACAVPVTAQRIEARLLDKVTNQPVEYANIGILNTETGTNSDSAGYFNLTAGSKDQNKTVIISIIGYEEYKAPLTEFINKINNSNHTVYLNKKVSSLPELIVKPAKLTVDKLGTDVSCDSSKRTGGSVPFPYVFKRKKQNKEVIDTLTEIGTLMKVKHRKTFIDSVQINIGRCTYESILYRLNIYEELDGDFKNVLNEPIYIRRTKAEVGKVIKVNLTDRNIVVNHNFIVSLEKVKDLGAGEMTICGRIFGPAMYMRMATINERFIKAPMVSMGIAAYVTFSEAIK